MKVAVYAIALNEEQFVQSWYESAKDADYLLIVDTGSTDKTIALAKSLGINVVEISINPWRFDDARNASLAAIPNNIDYCIALDMDEVLVPGWRKELEKAFAEKITRPRYKYTWNWKEDGSPGLQYGGDKIHSRQGYRWKHPVHEVLIRYGASPETQTWIDLEIHHHADNTKPRSQYLPLLKIAVEEDLHDDRNAFYYARELYFYGMYDQATKEFQRHLSLPRAVWKAERAASYRYLAKCDVDNAEKWLLLASKEDSGRRESWVDLAMYYYKIQEWKKCYDAANKALAIKEKPLDYLCEDFAWNETPYDLAAISAYNLGYKKKAIEYGRSAVKINPNDLRLANNLNYYIN